MPKEVTSEVVLYQDNMQRRTNNALAKFCSYLQLKLDITLQKKKAQTFYLLSNFKQEIDMKYEHVFFVFVKCLNKGEETIHYQNKKTIYTKFIVSLNRKRTPDSILSLRNY